MNSDNIGDLLDGAATANSKPKNSKTAKTTAPAKKGKTAAAPEKKGKAAKDATPAKKGKTAAAPEKKGKTAAAPEKKGKAADKPKKAKVVDPNISMTQPEDNVVLKAVRRLKEPTFASKFASDLGVHRRVIRAQLQRLSKEKTNGVGMKKDGPHWIVSNTAK